MSRPALLALAALVSLAACNDNKAKTAETDHEVKIDIAHADDNSGTNVTVNADTETGKLEVRLPGGIDAKVNLPAGMTSLDNADAKFDIDGVGLFPGAKVRSLNVNASHKGEAKTAVVKLGFSAPGDAAAVADWYQAQFEAKHKSVMRSGETLSGTTDDGDAFTIALEAAGTGASKGVLTITDSKHS